MYPTDLVPWAVDPKVLAGLVMPVWASGLLTVEAGVSIRVSPVEGFTAFDISLVALADTARTGGLLMDGGGLEVILAAVASGGCIWGVLVAAGGGTEKLGGGCEKF